MKKVTLLVSLIAVGFAVTACSPKVGSERWCKAMEKKDKGEWTANEAADYMKHCILDVKDE